MYRDGMTGSAERLRAAVAACATKEHLTEVRGKLADEVRAAAAEEATRASQAAREQADVERYQGGVWAFIYDLFADREARLTREQEEAVAATLRHQEAASEHARLRAALADVEARLVGLAGADDELAAARTARRMDLVARGGPVADELGALDDERGVIARRAVAVEEARVAGARVRATLGRLTDKLASARSWGAADIVTDSFLVSLHKRSLVSDARELAGMAQAELSMFKAELGDVGLALTVDVAGADDAHRFLDVWFDNIFSDLIVQDRIKKAQATTDVVTARVDRALEELARLRHASDRRLADVDQRIATLLATG